MASNDPIDEFIALPREQQLSTLQSLSPEKQDKLLATVKERRGASTKGPAPTANSITVPDKKEQSRTPLPVGSPGESFVDNAKGIYHNIGVGADQASNAILHPINTAKGFIKSLNPADQTTDNPLKSAYKGLVANPGQAAPEMVGQGIVLDAAGEAGGATLKEGAGAVGKLAPRGGKAVTDLVKSTKEANEASVQARKAALKDHFEATKDAREANEASANAATRKTALQSGVKKLSDRFQENLKSTRDAAKAAADAKYDALRTNLNGETVPADSLRGHLEAAAEKFEGSAEQPAIFKDIEKNLSTADSIPYEDLQGYYSEIGSKLQGGKLPGDVYQAYNTLQEGIGEEMQKIADRVRTPAPEVKYQKGRSGDIDIKATEASLPPVKQGYVRLYRSESPTEKFSDVFDVSKLSDFNVNRPEGKAYTTSLNAAEYYKSSYGRDAKTTYIDVPESVAKSAKFGDSGEYVINNDAAFRPSMGPQLADARQSWRNLKQTFYHPKSPLKKAIDAKEPGDAVGHIVGKDRTGVESLARYNPELARSANTIRGYAEDAKGSVPPPKVKEPPTLAPREPLKKLGAEDVQNAKAEALSNKADKIRNGSNHLANAFVAIDMIRSGLKGNFGEMGIDLGARGMYGIGKQVVANILEKPEVVQFLTKATPKDVMKIPPEMRGSFPEIIKQADAKGMKVSPYLRHLASASAFLAPVHPTDAYSDPNNFR